ncbi:MAG TPA: thiamine pyrophosphate-binding protein [Vicinamibacterales bacterium]|nr:thiamine pyrophosphate-binding protein [Vicinamibacterales bacterium]
MSTEMTGGELLVRCLASEGVGWLFGLPCPEIEPILASAERHGIRFVPVRHEAAAVHMAEGIYKSSGRVAAVIGNPGPGSANLLPGVITASHEGIPVVVITAQHRLGIVYPSSPATFQGQDQLDIFKPTVKWGAPLLEWTRIPEITRMAFREMWTGRPGPVHLEAPMPVVYETRDANLAPVWPADHARAALPQASADQIALAADILLAADSPMVMAGSGVDRADANDALLRIVELLGCPVMTSMAGRSCVPKDHPHHVYGFGAGGDLVRKEADVLLAVGTRMGNLDLPYDKYWGPTEEHRIVQIDVDARNIAVTRPVALGIVADARTALEALAAELRSRGAHPRRGPEMKRYRDHADKWWQAQFGEVAHWQGPGIHPAHAMERIGESFGRDAIYTVDGGMTSLWANWYLPPTRPRSYHGILELGMLGTGIPSAIGAKLANPTREVVCVTGDGAAGFNFMEMQTAAREKLAITTIVFAEGSWTMEEPSELAVYGRTFGTEMGEVHWERVGEGLGCAGEAVTELDELPDALGRAREHDGPSVVCVRSNVEANRAVPGELFQRFFEVYQGPMG